MSRKLTPVSSANIARLVNELQTIGDRFEKRGNKNWLPIARAAAILESLRLGISSPVDLSNAGISALIIELESIADHNEGLSAWVPVTKAASLLEGIRIGITTIAEEAPPENWFGIDMGTGDRTVFHTPQGGRHHAN